MNANDDGKVEPGAAASAELRGSQRETAADQNDASFAFAVEDHAADAETGSLLDDARAADVQDEVTSVTAVVNAAGDVEASADLPTADTATPADSKFHLHASGAAQAAGDVHTLAAAVDGTADAEVGTTAESISTTLTGNSDSADGGADAADRAMAAPHDVQIVLSPSPPFAECSLQRMATAMRDSLTAMREQSDVGHVEITPVAAPNPRISVMQSVQSARSAVQSEIARSLQALTAVPFTAPREQGLSGVLVAREMVVLTDSVALLGAQCVDRSASVVAAEV